MILSVKIKFLVGILIIFLLYFSIGFINNSAIKISASECVPANTYACPTSSLPCIGRPDGNTCTGWEWCAVPSPLPPGETSDCPPGFQEYHCFTPTNCGGGVFACGSCPSTPPPPPGPVCGDGMCNGGESCGSCASDCGACCSSSAPGAANLTSPADNAIFGINDIPLSWTNPTAWGTGCPNNNNFKVLLQPDCSGSFVNISGNLSPSTLNFTANNLDWGRTYCWRVQKDNGSQTANSSIRRFSLNRPPSLVSAGFTNADTCGGGYSGRFGVSGVTNPVDYRVVFNDADNDSFDRIHLYIVPSTGPYAENQATATFSSLNGKVANAKAIGIRYDRATSILRLIDNGGSFSGGSSSGNLSSQSGTYTILDIGGATNISTSGNTITANIRIQFNNSLTNGIYNIYSAGVSITPDGIALSNNATGTNNLVAARTGSWGIDMQNPAASVTGPTYNPDGTFVVRWTATDNTSLRYVRTYAWGDKVGGQLQDQTLPLLINLPITKPASPNAGITLGNINLNSGNHTYLDTTPPLNNNYSMQSNVSDIACNVVTANLAINAPSPWLISYLGSISSNGGIKGISVPTINNYVIPGTTGPAPIYFSTYSLLSGTSDINSGRKSRYNEYDTNYFNNATLPPEESGFTTWYDYLLDLVQKNAKTTISAANPANFANPSTSFSTALGVAANSKGIWTIAGQLSVGQGSTCNVKGLFFVDDNVIVRPDFLTSGNNGCIFVSRRRISFPAGNDKSTNSSQGFDIVEGIFISDSNIRANLDQTTATFWDGLIIRGSIITPTSLLERDLRFDKNNLNPAIILKYDPSYFRYFEQDLATRFYSIREQ